MNVHGLELVLADGIGPEQERALALVMLGLVVFAVVFLLVERQRRRRRRESRKDGPAARVSVWGPKTGASSRDGAPAQRYESPTPTPDQAPAERYESAGPTSSTNPDPMGPENEPLPSSAPAADDPSVLATPSRPDEIGIVMPEHEPPHAPQEPPPAG